jgi:hypothetical protein
LPDFHGIVFDPAGPGKDLFMFLLIQADNVSLWSKMMKRLLVVPRSRAPMVSGMAALLCDVMMAEDNWSAATLAVRSYTISGVI